jgi:regulation of enolase protein 1 (concanavalin A-like superfamily)
LDGFLITERIGQGEMGEIYRAHDGALKRDVAIKIVRQALAGDDDHCARLRQEAQAAASVSHPRVAQVYALGFSNGHPYLVMELVRGEDMDVILRRSGSVDERTVLRAAREVLDGLNVLHRQGLAHGDIKPANIVLDADGAAKLVDFGLSGMSRRDGSGTIHGTPHYIAPELLRGSPDTPLTDLYSLGATLYHLLAGRPPFEGKSPSEVVRARLDGPPQPIERHAPRLSPRTQRLVMRLLQSDPARRYPDCAAVLDDIQLALEELDNGGRPPVSAGGGQARPAAAGRRRPAVILILAAVAVAELVVLLRMGFFRGNAGREAGPGAHAAARTPAPTAATARARPGREAASGQAAAAVASTETPLQADHPPPEPAVFTRRLTPQWFSANLGGSVRGSTVWRNDALIVLSDGFDVMSARDDVRFVHAGVSGDFSLAVELGAVASTHDQAKTGLLLRAGRDDRAPGVFFGMQGDNKLLMKVRTADGKIERVRLSEAPVLLPCRLRVLRAGDTFAAALSGDNAAWLPFAECTVALPAQIRVGFAVASHAADMATAEFRDIHLLVP